MISLEDMRFHSWGFDSETNPMAAEVAFPKQHMLKHQKYCYNQAVVFHNRYNKLRYGTSGTSAIKGTQVLNGTKCFWQFAISSNYHDHTQIGIATDKAKLHSPKLQAILGQDSESWAVSYSGELSHDGNVKKGYISDMNWSRNHNTIWGIYFDGQKGTLKFYLNGIDLGVAFHGLDKVEDNLYPIVSTHSPGLKATITTKRINFDSLKDRCRTVILQQLPKGWYTGCPCEFKPVEKHLTKLPVPSLIQGYLSEELTSILPGHRDMLPVLIDCPKPCRLVQTDFHTMTLYEFNTDTQKYSPSKKRRTTQ